MSDTANPRDYERSDADPRLIAALAIGLAVFLIVTPFALLAFYPGADRLGGIAAPPLPPPPRLQVRPKADLEQLRQVENQRLTSFGWTDRSNQVVRIPIDRAMELLAQRGLADWPQQPASKPRPATN